MAETPEKVEDGGGPCDRDVAGFRERLFEDYEPEELEFPEWSEGGSAGQEGPPGEGRTGPVERASGEVVDQSALEEPVQPERPDPGEVVKEAEPSASGGADALVVPRGEVPEEAPAAEVEMPDFRRFPAEAQVEHGEEVRTFEAVDYGKGDVVRIPKSDLGSKGFEPEPGENAVVRVSLRDVEGEEVETAFARYNATDRRAEVYVGDIGGEKGSRYELLEAVRYDEEKFSADFGLGMCEHLANVRLDRVEEKVFLSVDGRSVELEEHRMSTSGSHVIMRGKLDGEDRCKIEFDGHRSSVRFGRDYLVERMRMEEDGLTVRFSQSWNELHERRIFLEHPEAPERPSLNQFGQQEMLEHVKMYDHPEKDEGMYHFVLDKEAQSEIKRILTRAEGRNSTERDWLKGEIGETLVPNMLEIVGWECIKRHPYSDSRKESTGANGPDWLLETPDGKLVIVEVKWWRDKTQAELRGSIQVSKEFDARHPYQGQEIVGAYVVTMEWNLDDEPVKVYVKRVRPEASLK